LFAILTHQAERLELLQHLPNEIWTADNHTYRALSIEEEAPDQKPVWQSLLQRSAIITYKKFWALDYLKSRYRWYVVVDAEFQFLRPFNVSYAEEYFTNKVIADVTCPSVNNYLRNVNYASMMTLPPDLLRRLDREKLIHNHFLWWNRIPIYAGSHIPHFLSSVHYYSGFLVQQLTSSMFDYLMYEMYLLSAHDFRLHSIPDPENLFCNPSKKESIVEQLKLETIDQYPMKSTLQWLPCFFGRHEILRRCPTCILAFHFDRHKIRCNW